MAGCDGVGEGDEIMGERDVGDEVDVCFCVGMRCKIETWIWGGVDLGYSGFGVEWIWSDGFLFFSLFV